MPAFQCEIAARLYEDALLELSRATRTFSAAIVHAAELADAVGEDAHAELAARVIEECRRALLPALVRAPGMLQLFTNRR